MIFIPLQQTNKWCQCQLSWVTQVFPEPVVDLFLPFFVVRGLQPVVMWAHVRHDFALTQQLWVCSIVVPINQAIFISLGFGEVTVPLWQMLNLVTWLEIRSKMHLVMLACISLNVFSYHKPPYSSNWAQLVALWRCLETKTRSVSLRWGLRCWQSSMIALTPEQLISVGEASFVVMSLEKGKKFQV